jgi:hypothetical protein
MAKPKPVFVKMTITYTFYGVGKTLDDAKQNSETEYNNYMDSYAYGELIDDMRNNMDFEVVKQEDTSIDSTYVDFIMSDEYEEL